MPAITLTDEFVRSVKSSASGQRDYPDVKASGLALRVSPRGTKSWTFRYRTTEGRQRRLKLGTYPATSLADARKKARDALGEVERSGDPAKRRQEEKAKALVRQISTLNDLAESYFEAAKNGRHRPNANPKRNTTLALERDHFDRLIAPKFGRLPVAELLRADFQRFLDGIGASTPGTARICRNVVRQMYNFAIRREVTEKNPAQFGEVPASKSRDRVLTDSEMKAIWRACETPNPIKNLFLSPGMALALRLAMTTLQRGNEICGMSKGEIDFEARIWTIPAERTKNHRLHVVPLSDLALELIQAALALPTPIGVEGKVRFLFPSPKGDQPITRRAFSRAMKRITEASKINDATPHDFRRTGSTHLTSERLGVPRFQVSCVLNHISDTGGAASVTAVYDRNAYLPEKRRALDKWANRLVEIVSDQPTAANMVRFR